MSNTIYSAILPVISEDKNKYNYVYQITEISTGMKYIGSRGTKQSNPLKDLKKYKSSTKNSCFELNQKLNPLNYHYEILSYHSTRDEATLEESRLHFLYDVKSNPKYYNRSNQTANGFSTTGKVVTKDRCGNIHFVNCNDPRYLSGELISISYGMIIVKDIYNNCYQVSTTDPRYLSGELVPTLTGKIMAKDKDGNVYQVDKDDPRYLYGELVGNAKSQVTVRDKNGNTYSVPTNDPRYLSGELVHNTTGFNVVRDKNGNTLQVSVNDPRYLSGELVSIATGKVNVKDKDGNTYQVSVNDPRYLSGELSHINKNKITAKDKNGNTICITKDDPRYLSGELIGIKGKWCKIDNILYSTKEVASAYNITISQVSRRCKSPKYNWELVN